MKAVMLQDRGVVRVSGPTARAFLDGLVTADMAMVAPDHAGFAALLSPQGKILFDFIVAGDGADGFLLDVPRDLAAGLAARLKFYRLRAKIEIEDVSDKFVVLAVWDGLPDIDGTRLFADPRLPTLGHRAIVPAEAAAGILASPGMEPSDTAAYEAHRIAHGVPQGGADFAYGDAFPHEADMDQLAGVDFGKGCYVGQEVVSRMQHRGTARTRTVPVAITGPAPAPATPVMAGERTIGRMGSHAGDHGLAMLRLDRVADAMAAGLPLIAGEATLTLTKPDWVRFAWPGEKPATAGAAE